MKLDDENQCSLKQKPLLADIQNKEKVVDEKWFFYQEQFLPMISLNFSQESYFRCRVMELTQYGITPAYPTPKNLGCEIWS